MNKEQLVADENIDVNSLDIATGHENIQKSYEVIENELAKIDLFMNIEQKKNDLLSQI